MDLTFHQIINAISAPSWLNALEFHIMCVKLMETSLHAASSQTAAGLDVRVVA